MNLLDLPRRRLSTPALWISRVALWLMLAAVAVASLLPGHLMPDIGAGHIEHFAAYLAFALAAALGYGWRLGYAVLLTSAVALAGLFELAQLPLAGRTGSWSDFAFGTLGALAGVSLAHAIRHRIGRIDHGDDKQQPVD